MKFLFLIVRKYCNRADLGVFTRKIRFEISKKAKCEDVDFSWSYVLPQISSSHADLTTFSAAENPITTVSFRLAVFFKFGISLINLINRYYLGNETINDTNVELKKETLPISANHCRGNLPLNKTKQHQKNIFRKITFLGFLVEKRS